MKPLEIILRVYDGFLPLAASDGVAYPMSGIVALGEKTIRREPVQFASGAKPRVRRDSVKTIEFSGPLVVRSVSDVTSSSTGDKADSQRPRIFSTEF